MATRLNVLERRFEGPRVQRAERGCIEHGHHALLARSGGICHQAGARRLIVDPYLSDTLAEKYKGTATPHKRMARPPVDPAGLGRIDLVLITHHHTDHMDPETLSPAPSG